MSPSPSYTEVDVAILGGGTAGMAAYRAAAAHTDRILLIEGGAFGTTCARVGCMPSKLLIAAAEAAHTAEHAGRFGIQTTVAVDGRRVMERVRRERDRFVGFVLDSINSFPDVHRRRGYATFLDDHTLQVGEETIRARAIVIATGSRPKILPMYRSITPWLPEEQPDAAARRAAGVLVSDDIFDWEDLPASLAVFGPGVIGLELGQALFRLGVRVRVFGVGGFLGPLADPEVRADAIAAFSAELPIQTDARQLRVSRDHRGVVVRWIEDGAEQEEHFELMLAATGRTPNVDRLGLHHTSLTLDARGVPLYDRRTLQCGTSAIFLAGDANADVPLLHEAADEGKIAGDNAGSWPNVRRGARRSPMAVMFTDPQIAVIGAPRTALADPIVGRVSFVDQGRSRVMLQNSGRLHVYADRLTGRLLGAEMVGPRAEHLAHLLAWAHQSGMTIPEMLAMPFYHPVVEEGLRTALRDAAAQLGAG